MGIVCSDAVPHVRRLAVHAADVFRELEEAYGLHRGRPAASGAAVARVKPGRSSSGNHR